MVTKNKLFGKTGAIKHYFRCLTAEKTRGTVCVQGTFRAISLGNKTTT